jgi:hypothetical protein
LGTDGNGMAAADRKIGRRRRGRPKRRWRDDIVAVGGTNWMAIALQDDNRWKQLEARFVHRTAATRPMWTANEFRRTFIAYFDL